MNIKARTTLPNETPAVTLEHNGETLTVLCGWFASCENPATGTAPHPILGDVPTCDNCNRRAKA